MSPNNPQLVQVYKVKLSLFATGGKNLGLRNKGQIGEMLFHAPSPWQVGLRQGCLHRLPRASGKGGFRLGPPIGTHS